MTLNIYILVLFEELLLEALFSVPVFLFHAVASLQAVQKYVLLTELAPLESWLASIVGSQVLVYSWTVWPFFQECLQSYLCDLYVVSVFCSYLYSDKEAAERLSKTVDEACLLLAEYNGRLAAELEDRRQLARMLVEYTQNQKEVLSEKEKKLEVSTLQNRPKLSELPFLKPHFIPQLTFFFFNLLEMSEIGASIG